MLLGKTTNRTNLSGSLKKLLEPPERTCFRCGKTFWENKTSEISKIEESLIDLPAASMRDNLIIVGILEQAEETKEATLTTYNPEAATILGKHY